MYTNQNFHLSPTGATLAYHHEEANGLPRAVVLICHGLAEHSRRYARFAKAMAAAGCHVYAHDHRGHGATKSADSALGRFAAHDGVAKVIGDVMAMRDLALSRHAGLPIVLLGHSMGGLIALNVAEEHPTAFQALSVWNSNFHPGPAGRIAQAVLKLEQAFKGSDVPSLILPMATFGAWGRSIEGHRTPFDWLSHDPVEVDAYIADPLCGFDASVSLWRAIFELTFRGAKPDSIDKLPKSLPIYLVGGGQDPATDKGRAIAWLGETMKRHGLSNVTVTLYPGMRHETLNEIGYAVATAGFAAWLDRILPQAPS
ncbi:alpha/beta fold hydrolase [Rhizobium sp. G187]|uniref:alpha/beta fold hydrolase n=1 Tax=Rhizobium sp. G187 TaxID=3451352 RepID=UPI003EE45C9C